MSKLLWLFLVLVGSAVAEKVRYDNFQVVRVFPKTEQHVNALKALQAMKQFSFWTEITKTNRPVDIMVSPQKSSRFNSLIQQSGMTSLIQIDNLQELIDNEELLGRSRAKSLEWTNYYPLEDLYAFLDDLIAANPTTVKPVVGGSTYEGRQIRGIEITNGQNLPGLILESGIHAREWIGPAASSWVVNEIVNSANNSIWRQFNYIYFPSVNPDGYVYTFEEDRMWRKTRTPYSDFCYGADPNRNYGYHWLDGGSSTDPCDETYAGPSAFSEIETKSLSEFLTSVSSRYDIHVAIHSYSQLLMFPWGYTNQHAANNDLWQRIGDLAIAALEKVHGTLFECGNIYETIYQTSGTSTEWYYGTFNNTLAYTFELRDTGRYGFVLPPDQIIPVAEELIAAFQVFLEEYQKL